MRKLGDDPFRMLTAQFDNFSWRYDGSQDWALDDVNLTLEEGEFVGIMGPSGAGKTTLTLCMNALIPQRIGGTLKGDVKILGKSIIEGEIHDFAKQVGLVFQDPETQFVSMRVRNEIAFGMENFGIARQEMERRLENAVRAVRMEGMLERSPTELSGGQKQRVAIASVLVTQPKLFVFDEPVSDLDPVGKREVYEAIAKVREETESTIVVIDHDLEEIANHVDRLTLMNKGRIILDLPTREFLEQVEAIESVGETVPQITRLFWELRRKRIWDGQLPATLDQARDRISDLKERFLADRQRTRPQPKEGREIGADQIVAEGISHVYPDGTLAVNSANLRIRKGEYLAIVGQNGSGKTTLVKHFNGLLKPTSGRIRVAGIDIPGARVRELARHVGYVFQSPDHQLFCNTVFDELMFGPKQLGLVPRQAEDEARRIMEAMGLSPWEHEHPFFLGKGQRRRLAVGSVLSIDPEILIVDEPTTGQDWRGSKEMMALFDQLNRDRGKTVIVITHNMRLVAEHCKRVIVMSGGRILYDGAVREA
ncbi:ABC transporter ATP-binding protein, partial [[Eubacterium] cellulosolvens]